MKMNHLFAAPLRIAVFSLFTLAACETALRATDGNPPDRMTYQGYLVDSGGTALGVSAPKNFDIVFRIYNHETATGASYRLWSELQTVTVDQGSFSVVLGEGGPYLTEAHPALSTVFTNAVDASDRYIEMTVKGIGPGGVDSTILPRLRLLASPYAMLARTAVNAKFLANGAGGQVVSITSTNVGINKASPGTALDVNGTISATALSVSGTVTFSGAVTASTLSATTVTGTAVNGTTITASSAFVGPGTIPVGGIIMWSGSSIPTGWALCNGSSVNGVQTPDLRDRFIMGSGSSYSTGTTGGSKTVTLSKANLPAHSHSYRDVYHAEAYSQSDSMASESGKKIGSGDTDYDNNWWSYRTGTTDTESGTLKSEAFFILPPYYALAFIMRVQ
jgi:microcystin-dependent protein